MQTKLTAKTKWLLAFLFSLLFSFSSVLHATPICPTAKADLWFANDESGSITTTEFSNALDFLYQISDRFVYDDATGIKAGITGWSDKKSSKEILIPISETFGDPNDSGFLSTSINLNYNGTGVRELYDTRQSSAQGTRLDYATDYLAMLIKAGNGRRIGVPQIAVLLTDASKSQITTTAKGGNGAWKDAATKLRKAGSDGTQIIVIVIEEAASAYSDDSNVKNIIDNVAGPTGKVIVVPTYQQAADPSNGYIDTVVQTVCATIDPTSLTIVGTINNTYGGAATINDLGLATNAGSLNFNTGTISGSITTYTSNTLSIGAGNYTLSANDYPNYTEGTWSCIGNSGAELVSLDPSNPQPTGSLSIAEGDSVICTLNYNQIDLPSCNALTGDINAGLSPIVSLSSGNKLFLGSTTLSSKTGQLKAYTVDSSGLPSGAAIWNTATQMTEAARTSSLYSTNSNQIKQTLDNLDDAAFNMANATAISTLKNILHAAPLGGLSVKNNLALITTHVDTLNYLNNSQYRTFYTNIIAQRTKRILASSNDGFLYAFNQNNGNLGWAWTPRSLVKELQYTATIQDQHYMHGKIDVLNLKHSGNYKTYIIGSYKQGLGQYVLNLSNNTASDLDEIVWDIDLSNSKANAPNNGERAYFRDNNTVYSTFVATGTAANSSTLYIYSLTDNSTTYAINLPFNATSTPYVMTDISQVGGKKLYLGDSNGNIYASHLLNSGALRSSNDIGNDFTSVVTTLGGASAVTYIGSVTATNDKHYLRAQSANRLSVYSYDRSNTVWQKEWTTSYTGENKRWTNGTNPSIDANIGTLSNSAVITANAYIVADSIVLPVMQAPTGNNCKGTAFYYFYRLKDGHFPSNTFFATNDNSPITSNIELGIGHAKKLHVASLKGTERLLGLGMAEQTTIQGAGINASFTIKDVFSTGIRSWRELRRN